MGEQLALAGSGFLVGEAVLELDGTLSAPGQHPSNRRAKMVLPVLATSASTASARLSRRHLEGFRAAHTTFSGRATLRFESSAGPHAPPVTASLDNLRLELFAGPAAHQATVRQAQVRGQAVLEELGITGSVLPEGRGVLVERIMSSSQGAHAGLQPGEIIVAAGNVTVASVADLAPPPRTDRLVLGVRDVNGQFRRVACALEQPGLSPDADRIAALCIATFALLFILLAAGPGRGVIRWLGAQVAHSAGGPRELLGRLGDGARTRPIHTMLAVLVFAASPFVVMAAAHFGLVLVAGLTMLAAVIAAITASRGWRRIGTAVAAALLTLPLVMLAAIGAVQATSMRLPDIVAAQGTAPWSWTAVADPGALMLLIIAFSVTTAHEARHPGPATALHRGLAGSLIAAVALGGWSIAPEHELWGQVLFAGKSWLVGICMVCGGRTRVYVVLPLSALLAAGSVAAAILPLPGWAPAALAWSAAAAAVFLLLPLAIVLVTRQRRRQPEDVQPDSRETWVAPPPSISPSLEAVPGRS